MTPMEEMARGLGTGDTGTEKERREEEQEQDVAVWTQHGACPMWVSLINRVSIEFYSSRYIIPLPPSRFPPASFPLMVPPTPPPHLLPPASPQDR